MEIEIKPNSSIDVDIPKDVLKGPKGDPGPQGEKGEPGTTIYSELTDKPSINGVELQGNKALKELGISEWELVFNNTIDSVNEFVQEITNADEVFFEVTNTDKINGGKSAISTIKLWGQNYRLQNVTIAAKILSFHGIKMSDSAFLNWCAMTSIGNPATRSGSCTTYNAMNDEFGFAIASPGIISADTQIKIWAKRRDI